MAQGTNPNIVKTLKRISREMFDIPVTKRIEDKRTKRKPKYKTDFLKYDDE